MGGVKFSYANQTQDLMLGCFSQCAIGTVSDNAYSSRTLWGVCVFVCSLQRAGLLIFSSQPFASTRTTVLRLTHRLVGLVVKASASRAEDPGFESRLRRDFSGSSHTSDFKIGTPVATLPGAWRYRVSAGTGRPGVSIL